MPTPTPLLDRVLWRCRTAVLSRPTPHVTATANPVTVAGLFRTGSGIGQSARSCADGLEKAGVPVRRVDLSAAFEQVDLPPDPRLMNEPGAGGTLILHLNGPEFERGLFELRNWRGSGRRVIGMWVWELPVPPWSWQPALRWLSEIWVPTQFCYDAIKPMTSKPLSIVPYLISDAGAEYGSGPDGLFKVLVLADGKSSFGRKNLLASLAAFQTATLGPHARLTIKCRNLHNMPELASRLSAAAVHDSRINILDVSLPHDDVMQLIGSADVVISLHRSEGFGLTLAEAMLRKKVVVATAWSGNMDFMDETSAIPVPYRLVDVTDAQGIYCGAPGTKWAEPDVAFAARALELLSQDPARRLEIGRKAREKILPLTTGLAYREVLEGSIAVREI